MELRTELRISWKTAEERARFLAAYHDFCANNKQDSNQEYWVEAQLAGGTDVAATRELLDMVHSLEKQHGPVKHVVLSTVAVEHKTYAGVWKSKFNLCFNSGSLVVCVRCCSLYAVEGIPRRSCPSLS